MVRKKSEKRILRQVWPQATLEFDGFRVEWSEEFGAWTIQFRDEATVLPGENASGRKRDAVKSQHE